MKATTPYQERAEKLRELAAQAESAEDRELLLKIADTWDWIARDYEFRDGDDAPVGDLLRRSKPGDNKHKGDK